MEHFEISPREKGERLAPPLSHSQMRVLAHLEEVVCDGAPDDVEAREVDQSCLEELRHGKQTGLSICGRKIHALFAQFTTRTK